MVFKVQEEDLCDWCGLEDESWATITHENAEGGKAEFSICGNCSDEIFSNKLSKKAIKRENWVSEL